MPERPANKSVRSRTLLVMDTSFHTLVKTECGRSQLAELQAKSGPFARLRLVWFLAIATVRDLAKR